MLLPPPPLLLPTVLAVLALLCVFVVITLLRFSVSLPPLAVYIGTVNLAYRSPPFPCPPPPLQYVYYFAVFLLLLFYCILCCFVYVLILLNISILFYSFLFAYPSIKSTCHPCLMLRWGWRPYALLWVFLNVVFISHCWEWRDLGVICLLCLRNIRIRGIWLGKDVYSWFCEENYVCSWLLWS